MSKYDKYFDSINELYKQGKRNSEISEELGINSRRISDQLRKNGLKSNKKTYNTKPTKSEEDVLISLAIGDGCIFKSKASKNYRVNLAHSKKQKYYFLEKYEQIKNFIEVDYFIETQEHSKTGNKHTCYKFQTRVHPYYTKLYNKFYRNGKKIIPDDFESIVNEKILAYKYFDDGYKVRKAFSISMHDYDEESVNVFQRALYKVFDIKSTLQNEGRIIYIPVKESNKFRNIISKYATQDLHYKL